MPKDYAAMSREELLDANEKLMARKAKAEAEIKAEQRVINEALSALEATEAAARMLEGMPEAQRVALAAALKGGE